MDKYFYSAKNNAFYPAVLRDIYLLAGTWPEDAVSINDTVADEFMKEPPEGKTRSASVAGYPYWTDKPAPTHAELVAAADAEKQLLLASANEYMNNKQWPGKAVLGRLKGDELAQYNRWLDYLDALGSIDTSTAPDIEWPEKPAT